MDGNLDPEERDHTHNVPDEQESGDPGLTGIEQEGVETNILQVLSEARVGGMLSQFRLDFSHMVSSKGSSR